MGGGVYRKLKHEKAANGRIELTVQTGWGEVSRTRHQQLGATYPQPRR